MASHARIVCYNDPSEVDAFILNAKRAITAATANRLFKTTLRQKAGI